MVAIVQVFLGIQAGAALQNITNKYRIVVTWIVLGTIFGILGGSLCGFTKNGGTIPLNKNLWYILQFLLVIQKYSSINS